MKPGAAAPAFIYGFSNASCPADAGVHCLYLNTPDAVTDLWMQLQTALAKSYTLERELGHGGMATVYLAHDLKHDRLVALKLLRPDLAASLGADRFLLEIKLAARLQHPHILPVFDSGRAQRDAGTDLLWFTMPYVTGQSLRQRLARERQLPLDGAVSIALQLADALSYAHAQGIVHRDVKPENILISGDHCLIADFGVARALDAAGGERLTATGLAIGTPTYMSPEQATGDALLDGRSDIYSLACVLYEMLAGEPPFTGRTAQAIVARRLSESVPPLRTVRDVPAPVERVVLRALARSPADRFRDASQFGRALHAATGPAIEPARGAPLTRRHRPARRLFLIAAGILLAVALGAGIYRRVRLQPEVALDPNLLAVAPFDVLDPSLQLWREGLGDILSRSLDGAGPLRTVSQTVALRHWQGRGDRASAETLGRRTGAGLVVYGVVLPKGRDSVSLRAEVLDGARGGAGPMEVAVSGEVSRIGELADSLGIEILQTLSPSRPIGAVRQVSMGSRSLPALKAFLQGEQFLRRGLWDSALARYDQSIAADSTFALALQRMDGVLGWNPATAGAYRPFGEYSRRAIQYNHGLSPRDSLLLAADSFRIAAETATEAGAYVRFFYRSVAALEEAVRRYPGAPEAWYALGEARYHAPRPLVAPPATVFKTFARTIALDSGFAPAYEHMPGLALRLGRPDLARHYANAYVSLDPTARNSSDTRLVALLLDRARDADSEAARLIDTASVHTLFEAVLDGSLALWPDSGETAVRLIRRMGEPQRADGGNAAWVLDSLMWPQYLAATLAFRGHLREAYEADERLLLDASASRWSAFLDPFLDLSLLGVIPDSIARSTFGRSFEAGASWGDDFTPRHLQGLPWWLAHRDSTSLERLAARAAKKSQEPNPPVITLRARLLGATASAFLALVRGDSVTALQKLQAIPDTLCMAANCFYLNFTLAKLLTARGEYRRAEVVLERWRWDAAGTPTFVLAMLERGRIAERLEEREKAIESYGFVADAWHRADPELEPYVIEAREGLRRLTRNR